MKILPPSIFNAYLICQREAWLMYHSIIADQHNYFIEIGRLIDELSYCRERKKIYLPELNAEIDFITRRNQETLIAEVKKSSRSLESSIFQLKYYLYLLKRKKSLSFVGVLKIPKERKNVTVKLEKEDEIKIENILFEARTVLERELPPKPQKMSFCYKCGHNLFCWS